MQAGSLAVDLMLDQQVLYYWTTVDTYRYVSDKDLAFFKYHAVEDGPSQGGQPLAADDGQGHPWFRQVHQLAAPLAKRQDRI